MESKHQLYKKNIFDDLRYLKYGYGGVMMKVTWTKHKTNEEIMQMVETERENGHC